MSPLSRHSRPPLSASFLASIVALSATTAAPTNEIVAFQISNGARLGGELPKRLKILGWGDNEIVWRDPAKPDAEPEKAVVRVGPGTVAALNVNQARWGYDRVALDYNHNSLKGHPNFKPDPREVAAYGVPKVVENDGLYLDDLEYTPTGEKYAREYCDLSPAPKLDANREVIFLHSTALCPQGAVIGLSYYNADFLGKPTALSTTSTSAVSVNMNDDLRKLLIALFNCPDDATDDDILAAGKTFATKIAAAGGPEAMSIVEQTRTNATRLDELERGVIIERAVLEGKIVPASAKTLAVTDLKRIVADLPANQVPLEQRTVALSASAAVATATESADAEEIRANCGVSKETWDKYYGPNGKLA